MRSHRLGAAAALLGVLAAACGGDDGSSDDAAATASTVATDTSAVSDTTAAPATTGGTGTTAKPGEEPASMEEWEALWADQRAAIVERIEKETTRSADGKKIEGPAGYVLDLSACPAGWSDTEGLTDTEIKVGQTLPQSGAAADYGNVGRAFTAVFDHYNEAGAFKDSAGKTRTINYIQKDDNYDPARTIPLVDELLDSERVFAMSTLGSAPALKTYDKLNERCVPQPFVQSGHPAWADPVNHPWTTGMQLAYTTEAVMWGAFVDQRFDELSADDGKVVVASLVSNNDFGKAYDVAFKAYVDQSEHAEDIEYVSETIEPTAPTVTDPMTTLKSKDPDVFIAMVFSSFCTQAVIEAAQNGMHDTADYLFQPSVCPGNTYVKADAVGGDGAASDGWWQVNAGGKDINDPSQATDPYIAWSREVLEEHGIDPSSSSTLGSGIYFAWSWVQAVQIAGELEGGLSRTNLMLAVHSMDMTHPYLLPGIKFNMDGTKDAYFTEGGLLQKWSSTKQLWEPQGNVIDLSGKSKNCEYDQSSGLCKSS
ncbi:MAG: ABC transporter substrate-binding protein [Acidimicrobiales bacterium]